MRLLPGLSVLALLAMTGPLLAQNNTTTPPANATTEAPANTPAAPPANNTMVPEAPANNTMAPEAPANNAAAPEAPANNSAAPTNGATPPANTTAAAPEGVSPEADKLLWCGQAFTYVSAQATAMGDSEMATQLTNLGADLTAQGSALQTQTGFTQEQLDSAIAAYQAQIAVELQGDGSGAKYTYDECVALPPTGAAQQTPANQTAPANNTMAPEANAMAPANNTAAPEANTMAPEANAMAPANNTMAPEANAMAPANNTVAPAQ